MSPPQLFAWRRVARQRSNRCLFRRWLQRPLRKLRRSVRHGPPGGRRPGNAGIIELEIDGITMRVGREADAKTVAAVVRVLKATS